MAKKELNPKLICTYDANIANKEYTSNYYKTKRAERIAYGVKYYAENKETAKQYAKNYSKVNRGYCRAKETLREQRTKQATPPWINLKDLSEVYKNKPEGYQVDHIIPLHNENVCGLNVPWNLQYLSPKDNSIKKNSFDGTKKNEGWKKKKAQP